jgi:CubicO group peptidase (beta-lactamase class C family)
VKTNEQKRVAVEKGLMPAVRIEGEDVRWSLEERMEAYNIPGIGIAVAEDGEVAWAAGYGSAEVGTDKLVDSETLFQGASISKVVNAFAVMQQVQAGLLDLDTDVNCYLESWQVPQNELTRQRPVTLRGILSHSAGLTVHGFGGVPHGKPVASLLQIITGEADGYRTVEVDILPGSEQRYSGGGTCVAQLILEEITGKSFATLVQESIFEPLGLERSTFEDRLPDDLTLENYSAEHDEQGELVDGRWGMYPTKAAGGLWTTPSEFLRFLAEIRRAWHGQSELLGQEFARTMLTRQPGGAFGLGPRVVNDGALMRIQHGGSNQGFQCDAQMYIDSGKGAVVMTNGAGGMPLYWEVLNAIASEHLWPGYLAPPKRPISLTAEELDRYVGDYKVTAGFEPADSLTVWREGDTLMSQLGGSRVTASEVLLEAPDRLFSRHHPFSVVAQFGEDGNVAEFYMLEDGYFEMRAVRRDEAGTSNRS